MISDPTFQESAEHKDAGLLRSFVMVTDLMESPLPEGFTPDPGPYPPTAEDGSIEVGHLIDYRDVRVEHMKFDDLGRVTDFGLPGAELDEVIDAGLAFRTSGCPGKFREDISACDRPYGDSPPSNIASYPFQPKKKDLKKVRKQLGIPLKLA